MTWGKITVLSCVVGLVACDKKAAPTPAGVASAGVSAAPSPSAPLPRAASSTPPAPSAPSSSLPASELARMFRDLSEPDRYFFSDNYVSNETSYLQVTEGLRRHAQLGGAYIGVGPEQNFTYIALLQPKIAFIVDIRRGNALEHLLYKSIFEEAETRAGFLSLLLGRPLSKSAPGGAADIDAVLSFVKKSEPDKKLYDEIHARLVSRIERDFQIPLSSKDKQILSDTHGAFFEKQLELRFELHGKNFRDYPSFAELLAAKDPAGQELGFLASDHAFRTVRDLQRQNRVIPVVGDFAGDHALQAVGKELRKKDIPVSAFYVSNVEQYVMEPAKWKAYVANIDALPTNEKSLFIRCYLDQGRRHPREMQGHRTATVLQLFDHFRWQQRTHGYGSFWRLATDGVLDADAAAP